MVLKLRFLYKRRNKGRFISRVRPARRPIARFLRQPGGRDCVERKFLDFYCNYVRKLIKSHFPSEWNRESEISPLRKKDEKIRDDETLEQNSFFGPGRLLFTGQ